MAEPSTENPLGKLPDDLAIRKSAASEMIIPGKDGTPDIKMHLDRVEKDNDPSAPLATRLKKALTQFGRQFLDPEEKIDKP